MHQASIAHHKKTTKTCYYFNKKITYNIDTITRLLLFRLYWLTQSVTSPAVTRTVMF